MPTRDDRALRPLIHPDPGSGDLLVVEENHL